MLKTVALLGATGDLGTAILEVLVAANFTVTAFKRTTSSATIAFPPDVVRVSHIPASSKDVAAWTSVLTGFDAAVVAFQTRDLDLHFTIAEAAAKAGVKRLIPADFGSADSSSPRSRELVPLFDKKTRIREQLETLRGQFPAFSWTSLVTGHFVDWGLKNGFMQCDLKKRAALVLGDGKARASASTLHRVGEAVAKVLEKDGVERLKNRMVYVQSFCVSQLDLVESLEKATGSKWQVTFRDVEEYIKEQQSDVEAGKNQSVAVENLVFVLGTIDGNWEERKDFVMDTLGLKNESLDEVVAKVIQEEQ